MTLRPRTILARFKRTLAAAGLPDQRLHDLRHYAATFILANGVPMRVVTDILGHPRMATTSDLYAHVLPTAQPSSRRLLDFSTSRLAPRRPSMPDYGHDLQFGFFLDPTTGNPERTVEIARILDDLGYDLIGIQDHPYQQKHFDAMALIGYLLGQTERIRIFPDVANLPLRPPAMLAKEAATLDQLSGGRFELGLGAGAFWDAIRAMGGPVREPKEALAALREATTLIRAYWSGQTLRHAGEIYQAIGARPGPLPAHDIGIWLGVIGPRALRLTGELAGGWVPSMAYVPPSQAAKSNAIIDEAARAAGREPSAIQRIYNIGGDVAPLIEAGASDDDQQIIGPRDHWVNVLTHLAVDHGFSTFVLWGVPTAPRLRMFIDEIAPAVKERVAEVRASRS